MFKKLCLAPMLFATTIIFSNSVSAASIANGTFDTGLSDWSQVTGNGSVEWDLVAQSAILKTGQGTSTASAVLVQGDDGGFNFPNPIQLLAGDDFLKFDYLFSALNISDSGENGTGSFTDNLQVWMYDANDISGGSDHSFQIAAIISATAQSIAWDISAFVGQYVAFSFELIDENDGQNYQLALDNIRIESRATNPGTVPEPSALLLLFAGGLAMSRRVIWLGKKVQFRI